MPLEPGDNAPDCTPLGEHDEPFSLRSSRQQRNAAYVVCFSPC